MRKIAQAFMGAVVLVAFAACSEPTAPDTRPRQFLPDSCATAQECAPKPPCLHCNRLPE